MLPPSVPTHALRPDHFPHPCQEWESVATAYTESHNRVRLNVLMPSQGDASEPPVSSHALSTAMTHALDVELHEHMQQQRAQLEAGTATENTNTTAASASPFSNNTLQEAGESPFSGTGPAPAAGHVAAAAVLTAPRLERRTVRAKLLVAADGPMSLLRQQCLGDGQPDFEVSSVEHCSSSNTSSLSHCRGHVTCIHGCCLTQTALTPCSGNLDHVI